MARGYPLYADEVREEVKASLTSELAEGEKLKRRDVVKAIAARWKGEEQDVRDDWNLVERFDTEPHSDFSAK